MRTPQEVERGLAAPDTLGLETRVQIRKAAIELLEEMPEGTGRLVIDLSRTRQIDSAVSGELFRTSTKCITSSAFGGRLSIRCSHMLGT